MSEYRRDEVGMREFLRSDMLLGVVLAVAEEIKMDAIATAPVGSLAEHDRHPGEYISSFGIRSHRDGGATHDRVEAIVYNDGADALWVEYGHHGSEPFHTLRNAAFRVVI